MTLRNLLDTLKGLNAKLALHAGDAIAVQPPEVLTPTLRAALTEHHAALVALIRSEPSSAPSFHAPLTALDGLARGPRPAPAIGRSMPVSPSPIFRADESRRPLYSRGA
jgi:hypothetical protein